jgi:hypothetical protein
MEFCHLAKKSLLRKEAGFTKVVESVRTAKKIAIPELHRMFINKDLQK